MLVLSRKPGERVRIGTDISLVIVAVSGNRVRLGFTAPAQVRIARQELDEPVLGPSCQAEGEPEERHPSCHENYFSRR